jgi:hypothetical protein
MSAQVLEKLKSLIDENRFQTLVNQKDLDVYSNELSEYLLPSYSDLRIELAKEFSNGKKWYGIHFPGAPVNLHRVFPPQELLIEIKNYIIFFEDDLSSTSREVLIHQPFMVENSYDNSQIVRENIKRVFKQIYSYDEELITKCFDVFDGANVNYTESINIDRKRSFISFSCYEVNDYDLPFEVSRDLVRNKDVIQRLGEIYEINSKPLSNLITKLEPIIKNKNIRLYYSLHQSESKNPGVFGITFTPHYSTEDYLQTISDMCDNFRVMEMLSPEEANDLKNWTNFEDRLVTGFSLEIQNNKKNIDLSFRAHYGFVPTIVEPEPTEFYN